MVARSDRGYGPRVTALAPLLAMVLAGPPGSVPRGNTVLDPGRDRSFGAAAVGRFGWLLGGGSEFVQPFGFGFAAQLRFHLLKLGLAPARFGFSFHGGHTRFVETDEYVMGDPADPGARVNRTTILSHTDLSLGPAFEIIAGPLILFVDGGAGVGVNQLTRPLSADPFQDQEAVSGDFLLRGGLGLGIPIRNNHGIVIGAGVQKFFSRVRRPPKPLAEDGAETQSVVFDLLLEAHLGYQAWF
jgi:hypothetical protein